MLVCRAKTAVFSRLELGGMEVLERETFENTFLCLLGWLQHTQDLLQSTAKCTSTRAVLVWVSSCVGI
jgi:hypothetical protein